MYIYPTKKNITMIPQEVYRMKTILDSFLGESKQDLNESYQLEYPCPRCVEKYGNDEIRKCNLSLNIKLNKCQCWKCSDEGDADMKGSVVKLIKLYGNNNLLKDYKDAVHSLRESKMYKINFSDDEFNIDTKSFIDDSLSLPKEFRPLREDRYVPKVVLDYLYSRGIGWDIIKKHNMGYTEYCADNYKLSNRVFIPSYDEFGELNYWTGRDYTGKKSVVKYYNPKVERKDIIFNEELIQWDADIVLVEGPFDHIVIPNSIPLLGKELNHHFSLFYKIIQRANANVIIMLDADAYDNVVKIYSELNHGRLYGKIRFVPLNDGLDPSEIYQKYGKKGILSFLRTATKIDEIELNKLRV